MIFRCGGLVPIYPTPPLGEDMTQGQFLSGGLVTYIGKYIGWIYYFSKTRLLLTCVKGDAVLHSDLNVNFIYIYIYIYIYNVCVCNGREREKKKRVE